jgi:glutathione S-transferase
MTTLRLYYGRGACSLAPHVALEEAGAAFEPIRVALGEGEQRTSEYRRINPKGRVPALARGDWVLTEVPAILRYVARAFPEARLWPEALEADARCAEWLAWLSSGVHVAYAHISRAERYAETAPAKAEVVAKGVEACREVWRAVDAKLGRGPWAVGDTYSVADPYLLVIWTWGRLPTSVTYDDPPLGLDAERDLPNWTAHARRMAERPAVQRAFRREEIELAW